MKNTPANSRRGLFAGGNWTMDHLRVVEEWPQPDGFARVISFQECGDGAPYNVLLTLALSGAPFPLMAAGLVGKDEAGARILAECRKHKIDTRHLAATPRAPTAFTDVIGEQAGARTQRFLHSPGANALWSGNDLDFTKTRAKHFHLGHLLLLDALDRPDSKFGTRAAKLLAAAQSAGLKTSVDVVPGPADRVTQVVQPALKFTDYLVINEQEAACITGFKVRGPDGTLDTVCLRHAAGALLQQGVRELVVLHFPEGAFARTRKGEDVWQSSVKLPPKLIAGKLGAGDAFCAGFLLGVHEGWETRRCLATGVCIAAACLTGTSCIGGIKRLNTSLELGKKYKFHPPLERFDEF